MSRYKRWEDHSAKWKRNAEREGLSASRWNGWLKLSSKTQKESDPRKYAAGQSIADQRLDRKRASAISAIKKAMGVRQRDSVIAENVNRMSGKDLEWTASATPGQIRRRAGMKNIGGYERNPWWAYGR